MKGQFLYLAATAAASALPSAVVRFQALAGRQNGPTDPGVSKDCTFFETATSGAADCARFESTWVVSHQDLVKWNPSLKEDCSGIVVGHSYCVEVNFGVPLPSTTTASGTTTTGPGTPTKTPNGVETPQPTQPDVVDNCNKFHLVKKGEGCASVASWYGITLAQFQEWNPSSGKDCTGLWADAYACVSVIGGGKPTPTNPPTTTGPTNGVETPKPTQPDMTENCKRFHLVQPGQGCASIAAENGLTLADFAAWNPKVGTDCTGLWAQTYACVAVIGDYDFEKGHMAGWTVTDGAYDATSRALVGSNSRGGKALINTRLTDFIYEADITLPDGVAGNSNAGLVFRVSNAGPGADNYRGYYVGIGPGSVVLGRTNKDWRELGRGKLDNGRKHHVKVRAIGDSFAVYVDDMNSPKISARDAGFGSGVNGVRVYETSATFDNIRISPVVHDDFNDGTMSRWVPYDGTYSAISKALVTAKSAGGKAILNLKFADFTYEADVTLPNYKNGNAGLVFRASDAGRGADNYRGYYAGIGSDGVILGRANKNWQELGRGKMAVRSGQTYHVMIRASGDSLLVYVDDMEQPKISLRDATYKSGLNGVRVDDADASFDNVVISTL